jgi:uncharacterized membrane protein
VRLRVAIAGCASAGIAIAAYLTVVHYAHTAPVCTTGGCEKVQKSSYAELAGAPVALLGLLAYLAIVGTTLRRGVGAALVGAGLGLVGAAFSGYLLWAQLARIHAICQWCVGSAVLMTALMILTLVRLLYVGPRTSARPDSATAHSATDAPAAISRR